MNRGSTLFLRSTTIAISLVILALCIFGLPALWRGVAVEYPTLAHQLYGLLILMYAAAVPFFIGAYQALRLLWYIDKNKAFSRLSVTALKRIMYCAATISVLYTAALPLMYQFAQHVDAPGVMVIGMVLVAAPLTIAVLAGVLRQLLQEAITIKKENDLTV